MRRLAGVLVLASMIVAGVASASYLAFSLSQRADTSDAIVVGRFEDVRVVEPRDGHPLRGVTLVRGTIHVEETLWSRLVPQENLILEWASSSAHPRANHEEVSHARRLWLLVRDETRGPELVYRMDYPNLPISLEFEPAVSAARRELASAASPSPRVHRIKRLLDATAAQLKVRGDKTAE
jgi:hypothetical protein